MGQYQPSFQPTVEMEAASRIGDTENLSDEVIIKTLMDVVKERHRWMRGSNLFRFTANGTSRARRSCRLCQAHTTWCSKWPRTDRSKDEEREDVEKHIAKVRDFIQFYTEWAEAQKNQSLGF